MFTDGEIYKLVVKEPLYTEGHLSDGSGAHCGGLCACFDKINATKIQIHDPPKLYLIEKDPQQVHPVSADSHTYLAVVPTMLKELGKVQEEERSTNMKCQYEEMWK